jgi:hypothetical protein
MGLCMRRFSVALLVLIVLGIFMTIQPDEPDGQAPAADVVTKKAARRPHEARKEAAARPAEVKRVAEAAKVPASSEAAAAAADPVHEMAASTPAPSDPAHELLAARTPQTPAVQEKEAASHTPASATSATEEVEEVLVTSAASAAEAGKAAVRPKVDDTAYLPPWQQNRSRSAEAAEKSATAKPQHAASSAPKRTRVTRRAEPARSRSRAIYRTAPTSSYGGWDERDWRPRRRRGNCYIASDGVLECDRGRVYFRR